MKRKLLCIILSMLTLFATTVSAGYEDVAERTVDIAAQLTSANNVEMFTGEVVLMIAENNILKELENKGQTAAMQLLKGKADAALKTASGKDVEAARANTVALVSELQKALGLLGGGYGGSLFSDVSTKAWYYNAVKYTTENGIFAGTGDNKFEPETEITRSMFLALMGRMYLDTTESAPSAYTDVPSGSYYVTAVNVAAAKGILTFISGDKFYPNQPITREELVTVLRGSMAQNGEDTAFATASSFKDNDAISEWAKDSVSWAADKKIVAGFDDGTFGPQRTATRSQVAQILYGVCK